uniref:CSON008074 protein n=1 Tax=Culicoides sonorensis TaxID=179676 RepID=A0A336LYG2_CULSO
MMTLNNKLMLIFLFCAISVCIAKKYHFNALKDNPNKLKSHVLSSQMKEFTFGSRRSGDSRIYRKTDKVRGSNRGTKIIDVDWDGIEKITQIHLEVTSDNGKVSAKVIKGGVGKDNVRIEVRGRNTKLLEYFVEVYGKP